jgi:nitronate monooxygenase
MRLTDLCPHPIIQGPMAGGANTPAMVAAVSNAGGLGSLGASLLAPNVIKAQVEQIRSLTDKPFAINLFVQETPQPIAEIVAQAAGLLEPVWRELGMPHLTVPEKWCEDFAAQFAMLLELKPAVASFTFNILQFEQVQALHEAGILVVGTATTLAEAEAWQALGADAAVASGIEAGGHRGTFLVPQGEATLSVWDLAKQVCPALQIPVILAGGMMDGKDIAAALKLGAQAVQMGTAFLVTEESGIHAAYKQRLIDCAAMLNLANPTRQTRAFSGRYARGLENRFMAIMQEAEMQVPAYPVQNALTGSIRAHAAKVGNTEFMSLWAGMQVARARPMPCAQLMQTLVQEWQAASSTT